MYVTHRLRVINSCAKYGMTMSKDKKLLPEHKAMSKLYKIHLEMNVHVRNVSSHCERPLCET